MSFESSWKLILENQKKCLNWTNILHGFILTTAKKHHDKAKYRDGSKNPATCKMELFFDKHLQIKVVSYYHKELYPRCCSSPRSSCEIFLFSNFLLLDVPVHISLYKTKINWFGVSERVRMCLQPSELTLFIRKTVHTDFLLLPFPFY